MKGVSGAPNWIYTLQDHNLSFCLLLTPIKEANFDLYILEMSDNFNARTEQFNFNVFHVKSDFTKSYSKEKCKVTVPVSKV